jgi:hypothetical protein
MARSLVVLDIDGVLADVRHRLHLVAGRPKNWDAFFAAADRDEVLEVGAQFARQAASSHEVVYLTGRPERVRTATQSWLDRHALPPGGLLMRAEGDRRPSAVVKLRELHRLRRESSVDLIVDDDLSVVEAARAAGFTVRHADWMPTRPLVQAASTRDDGLFGTDSTFATDALFTTDVLHDAQERSGRT